MQAIIREENSIEDFKNQSYSIEKLGTGGEIACTKQLLISTGLSKPKVKALLMAAKNVRTLKTTVYFDHLRFLDQIFFYTIFSSTLVYFHNLYNVEFHGLL